MRVKDLVFRALFPFSGIGGGALGFQGAEAEFRTLGIRAHFQVVGGIEWDPSTAADFTRLTGAPCMVADVATLTAAGLRAQFGACPDVVFFSPPCKPASGLLAADVAATPKYRAMAMLGAVWVDLMFEAWPEGPKLLIMENVPRIRTRAPEMMEHIRKACCRRGYHITEASHDLGELGGLAQHRDRLLFVGRRKDVSSLLYQPIKRRVRSVGEVLGSLPLPGDPAAGPLHTLPAIEAITALRLALIPAGGDWRDLPSQVHLHPDFAALLGQKRQKASARTPFNDVWRVVKWNAAAGCVTGGAGPSSGGMTVADPRLMLGPNGHTNICAVTGWEDTAGTVTGASRPASGAMSVADPREGRTNTPRRDDHGVIGWDSASGVMTGETRPSNGRFSVADPRTGAPSHPHTYGVVPWSGASHTITGNTGTPGGGPFTVADPRVTCKTRENSGIYGVLPWGGPAGTVVGHACHDNGRFSVADPRPLPAPPFPIIIAEDGTWHRPLTALECAVLQGFPATVDGEPFVLEGSSNARRVKIGDAVPPKAAREIAVQMLHTLTLAAANSFALSSGGAAWVRERAMGGVQ